MRKIVAGALISCLLATGLTGCSQPIDNGSEAPPQSQALLALVGIAGLIVAYVAFRHHNENRMGGGGGGSGITSPINIVTLTHPAIDMSVSIMGTAGVLESGTPYKFEEVSTTGSAPGFSYSLPVGYAPIALAIDASNNEWFVDSGGNVKTCISPSGFNGTCTPLTGVSAFNDGLAGNFRSITADTNFAFFASYASGMVTWKVFSFSTDALSGPTSYSFSSPLYTADAADTGPSGSCLTGCQYYLFHQNGASWLATVSTPSMTVRQNDFSPVPNSAPAAGVDSLGNSVFYALIGSPTTGLYQIAKFLPSAATNPITPTARIPIANNGAVGGNFTPPLTALYVDPTGNTYAVDNSKLRVVVFGPF